MSSPQLLTALFPDLVYHQDRFTPGLGLLISELGILSVQAKDDLEAELARRANAGEYITSRRLPGKAVMPGLINTHSHAFQRAIRARTEYPRQKVDSQEDFWSWREIMYQTALELSPTDVEAVAQAVYVEMVKSGITHVGEFHYLHHKNDGSQFEEPDELAWRVLSGAKSAGIGVTLLRAFYQRAGVGRPAPQGAQKIFCDPNLDFYLETLDRLRARDVKVGVTAHSVRAVPKDDLSRLLSYAKDNALPFHIHASEQEKEIEECREEYGLRPVELLNELGALGPSTTLVHAIHLSDHEVSLLGDSSSNIASCPTTERNLGDGIVPALALLQAGAKFTFGSDSQCQISLFEDARQLEYHLRLRDQRRSLLFGEEGEAGKNFLDMITKNGARALHYQGGGELKAGAPADLVALNLNHLSLAGSSAQSLPLDLIFSANNDLVTDVWVGAQALVTDGHHRAEKQAQQNLHRVMAKLRG